MSTVPHTRRSTAATAKQVEISQSELYLQQVAGALKRLPFALIDGLTDILWNAYRENRAVYIFGNGGSAALASHCACDFGKGTVVNGHRRFRVLALTDNVPLMTAWANDARYEDIFAQQLQCFLQKDDVAFAISGSGNSPNVLNALQVARDAHATTVGLTGFQGGKMKALCDLCVIIPSNNMQVVEDGHLAVAHSVFTSLRERIMAFTAHPDLVRA